LSEIGQNIGSYLIQRIYDYGVRRMFGVPGDFVLGFYHQLMQSNKLKVINTCDEQGAAFAADKISCPTISLLVLTAATLTITVPSSVNLIALFRRFEITRPAERYPGC